MIDVRIRWGDWAKGVHLTDVMFTELDTVIPTLKSWGVCDAEGFDLVGQIVVDDTAAYFEVVIVEDEV